MQAFFLTYGECMWSGLNTGPPSPPRIAAAKDSVCMCGGKGVGGGGVLLIAVD